MSISYVSELTQKECPQCGIGQLYPRHKIHHAQYGSETLSYSIFAAWCNRCEHGVILKKANHYNFLRNT